MAFYPDKLAAIALSLLAIARGNRSCRIIRLLPYLYKHRFSASHLTEGIVEGIFEDENFEGNIHAFKEKYRPPDRNRTCGPGI